MKGVFRVLIEVIAVVCNIALYFSLSKAGVVSRSIRDICSCVMIHSNKDLGAFRRRIFRVQDIERHFFEKVISRVLENTFCEPLRIVVIESLNEFPALC